MGVLEWDTYIAEGAKVDELVYLVLYKPLMDGKHVQSLNGRIET